MTIHLQQLHRAALITQQRSSRQLIYAADFDAMNDLVGLPQRVTYTSALLERKDRHFESARIVELKR